MPAAGTLAFPRFHDGYGDAIFQRHQNDDGTLSHITCLHADPRIRISDVVLEHIASGEHTPGTHLALPDGTPVMAAPDTPESLTGAVLTIACANRRLVYRITGWEQVWLEGDLERGSYTAEWPD